MEKFQNAMQVFNNHYQPAETFNESDDQFTTEEILTKFSDLLHDKDLTSDKLYELLIDSGYKFEYVIDQFKWLLKIR